MDNPGFFADANASLSDAKFVFCGVSYDETSTFRKGAAQAPKHIRSASWNFETFNLNTGVDLQDLDIHDYGDIDVKGLQAKDMTTKVTSSLLPIISSGKFPLVMGGEHSITPGVVRCFPKDIAVVSLDAHLDFRQQYESDPWNHACVMKRIADHLPVSSLAVLGIRSAEQQEMEEAKQNNLFIIDAFDIKKQGWGKVLNQTKQYLLGKPVYLTIDIDVVDPAFAPGTSTPEPFGLSPYEIVECIEVFAPHLVGCDLVEVCPSYDHGQTALLAARLLRWVVDAVSQHA